MKIAKLALGLALLLSFPSFLRAELFQWTDGRGVIHFTDHLESVPEPLRNSPRLIVRQDLAKGEVSSTAPTPPVLTTGEPVAQPKAIEEIEPEPAKVIPQVVHYQPQYSTVVVVNTIVHQPRKKKFCAIPEGCPPAFRPNFNDRRYIHPSVFDGGSRQYIHPQQ